MCLTYKVRVLCMLAGLLSCCIVHGRECQCFKHANGSASYYLSGKLESTNCSTLWSANGTVISWKDGTGEDHAGEVLAHDSKAMLLKICREDLQYKEECPGSGVVKYVPCSCKCIIRDAGHMKRKTTEALGPEGGSSRSHIAVIVALIVASIVAFVIAILITVYGLVCRSGAPRRGAAQFLV
ncbi:hypothetical protein COCON_G00006010 [Conger conger]|uniref:Uncharacterized protein n=1 Tax=Conger conger TaxID=82655 RepID=A0A9Q1E1K5_CONCO|nr:hypothetical protein COCON_G00006010 [Conger conger]